MHVHSQAEHAVYSVMRVRACKLRSVAMTRTATMPVVRDERGNRGHGPEDLGIHDSDLRMIVTESNGWWCKVTGRLWITRYIYMPGGRRG